MFAQISRALVATLLLAAPVLAQIPVSQATYDNIVTYSAFAAAAYGNKCAKPAYGAQVVQYFNNAATDTQGTLFYRPSANQLILSLRGTSAPADVNTDFNFGLTALNLPGTSCSGCQVHTGFQNAYRSISSAVEAAIKSQLAAHPGASILVTGHSLGAGLASLASSSLTGRGFKVAAVYTYGEPLNGNPAFTTYINKQIPTSTYFRVTHANDGVPQIPPAFLGFQHHGTEYWQRAANSSSASTTLGCPGISPLFCNAAQSFGDSPINAAHLFYGKGLIGNALHIQACGASAPFA